MGDVQRQTPRAVADLPVVCPNNLITHDHYKGDIIIGHHILQNKLFSHLIS